MDPASAAKVRAALVASLAREEAARAAQFAENAGASLEVYGEEE